MGYRASFYGDGSTTRKTRRHTGRKRRKSRGEIYNDYAKAQYQAALDKTYRSITGKGDPHTPGRGGKPEAQNLPDAGQGDETPTEQWRTDAEKGCWRLPPMRWRDSSAESRRRRRKPEKGKRSGG